MLKLTKYIPHKPFAKQIGFMLLPHLEALYGGQAGGGKSDALLMCALQYVDVPGFAGILFRKTLTDHKQPGALLARAHEWLGGRDDLTYAGNEHTYYFPTRWPDGSPAPPAALVFGYIGEANAKVRYKSAEYQFCAFDEVTEHNPDDYTYMFSRLRKKVCQIHKVDQKTGTPNYVDGCMYCDVYRSLPVRMRAATNPGGPAHQFIKDRFKIVPSVPIPDDELNDERTDIDWVGKDQERPFISASYRDNPFIDQKTYGRSLDELPPTERAKLKFGNWAVNVSARFRKKWLRYYSTYNEVFSLGLDGRGRGFHFSDFIRVFGTVDPAASSKEGMAEELIYERDPSFTVICVWGLTSDNHLLLLDMLRFQKEVPEVVEGVVSMWRKWRPSYFCIEANGSGQAVCQYAMTFGVQVKEIRKFRDKVVNSTSAQLRMKAGRIWIPQESSWKETWEAEVFNWTGDGNGHDDIVDTLSDAANEVAEYAGDDINEDTETDVDSDFAVGMEAPYVVSFSELRSPWLM